MGTMTFEGGPLTPDPRKIDAGGEGIRVLPEGGCRNGVKPGPARGGGKLKPVKGRSAAQTRQVI